MDSATIKQGMDILVEMDEDLMTVFNDIGYPPPRVNPEGFETLLFTIVSQLLSTKAATAIMQRVTALMPEVTPENLNQLSDQTLRDAGLSWRKVEYAKGLAQSILNGDFDMDRLATLDDESAIKEITELRGFGRWSAETYLIFSLKRQDVFPADDLALLVALGELKGHPDKPTAKHAREMVAHWEPWRSVGSLFLWHFYHQIKG